jgi:predicted metal-binding membrane protein
MAVTAEKLPARGGDLAPAWAAARVRLGLVGLLLGLAGIGWWWTTDQMQGMDNGPWTGLGTLGWFLGLWVVMMAAMMFPSIAPTIALYSRMTRRRSPLSPLLFAAGYLLTWAGAGLLAFLIGLAAARSPGDVFAWRHAGRWLAGGTIVIAAGYELSPLKDICLGKCRSPLGFLLGSWRDGWSGALRMGTKNGAWCVACCWGLMASLFALGVMSVAWMAIVAALIAIEKTLRWRRLATYATAALLLTLGVLLLTAPDSIPGLTTPASNTMHNPTPMGS